MKHRSVVIRAGWTAALALLALLSGGSLAGAWNASAPAALAAYTEPEKAAQRQAGTTALKQMYAALDAKKSGYTFPPGVYRFTGSRPFNFSKKSNFAVHAAGCTFVMENLTGELFLIQDCSQMAIVGPLTLDADPLRFSQAKVMARNDGAGTADIQIMSGYPTPPAKARMMIFGPDGVWQSPSPDKQWPFLEYSDFTWQDEARKVGRIAVNPKILPLLKPGNYITLGAGDGIGTLRDVDGMTLQDITAYTGCTSLISWGGGSGVWHYTRVRAIPEPGTSRLIGGSGPQHSFGAGSTVVFDGCEFNGSTDDDLNVGSGTYGMLYKQETPRTILVMNGGFKSGDKVRVFENSAARETARALVQKAEPLEDAALKADARKSAEHAAQTPRPRQSRAVAVDAGSRRVRRACRPCREYVGAWRVVRHAKLQMDKQHRARHGAGLQERHLHRKHFHPHWAGIGRHDGFVVVGRRHVGRMRHSEQQVCSGALCHILEVISPALRAERRSRHGKSHVRPRQHHRQHYPGRHGNRHWN